MKKFQAFRPPAKHGEVVILLQVLRATLSQRQRFEVCISEARPLDRVQQGVIVSTCKILFREIMSKLIFGSLSMLGSHVSGLGSSNKSSFWAISARAKKSIIVIEAQIRAYSLAG
jgi:hypothetical protein